MLLAVKRTVALKLDPTVSYTTGIYLSFNWISVPAPSVGIRGDGGAVLDDQCISFSEPCTANRCSLANFLTERGVCNATILLTTHDSQVQAELCVTEALVTGHMGTGCGKPNVDQMGPTRIGCVALS